jgi:hypothetical protein
MAFAWIGRAGERHRDIYMVDTSTTCKRSTAFVDLALDTMEDGSWRKRMRRKF